MAKKEKEKIPAIQITTPIGLAKFPHLIKVDPDDAYGGDYTVTLLLDEKSEECKALIQQLEEARDHFRPLMEAREGVKNMEEQQYNWPAKEQFDKEGNPTGMIGFDCKSKGSYKRDGETIDRPHPTIYDANANKIKDALSVIGPTVPYNSKIRLCLNVAPYYAKSRAFGYGITLYISSTQIIELANASGAPATAEACGFAPVEGGYAPSTNTPQPEDCPF